jgi:hypothetical protein
MINRECFKCGQYVSDVWVLVLSDEKEKFEFSGHKNCIDELDNKVKSVKDYKKKPLNKLLKEIENVLL